MRATIVNHRTPWRRTASFFAAAMLAASMFASPAAAAPPNWSIDPVTLLPSAVTPGDAAGYQVTIRNGGPSNISQLYLIAYLGTSTEPAPNPVFTSTTRGSCPNTGGTLYCNLGSLRKDQAVSVTVAFPTPSDATSFSVRFEANTTGATTSDGGASHGDAIQQLATTALTNDPNFAGRFVTSGLQTVANSQTLSSGNPQTTKVNAPALAIGVTVQDGTPASDWCPNCDSQTSQVNVNQGALYPQGFRIDIQVSKDLVNGSIETVYHQKDDLTVEAVTTQCPKNGNPNQNQMPCFKTQNLGGGNTLVIIWTKVNGKWGM